MHTTKKIVISLFGLAVGFSGAFLAFRDTTLSYNSLSSTAAAINILKPKPPAVHLTFVGDIMLGRGVKTSVYKNFAGDYAKLFEYTAPFFTADDITFANLEGPVSDRGRDMGSKFSFHFEPKIAPVLKASGIDIVSVANNHEGDWSRIAYDDTLKYLTDAGVLFAGGGENYAKAIEPTIIEKNGVTIGFLGFTDVGPHWMPAGEKQSGVLLADDPNFDSIIKNASTKVDFLIVSFHFGVEYNVGKHTERQALLAHKAIDDGAKIIIGHHPHVIGDTENYNGGFIAYSLGNFIFDQPFSKDTMQGGFLEISLDTTGILSTELKTIKSSSQYAPSELLSKATE